MMPNKSVYDRALQMLRNETLTDEEREFVNKFCIAIEMNMDLTLDDLARFRTIEDRHGGLPFREKH
jgi:hypothetical protein